MTGAPPGSRIRQGAWLCVMLAGACGDSIALGSECPPFGAECVERGPRERPLPIVEDSGLPDADSGRYEAPIEADAGDPGSLPMFRNPSFEVTSGSGNGGLISTLTVQVSPWLSCSPPGFGPGAYPQADLRANFPVGAPGPDEVLAPTEGKYLINASPDGFSMAQTLGEPLRANQPYAFLVDLAATQGSTDLVLDIQGSNTCFGPQTLFMTPPVKAGAWTSVCVRFVPKRDYNSIMLAASSASAGTGTRLFIDNIRADPSCQ